MMKKFLLRLGEIISDSLKAEITCKTISYKGKYISEIFSENILLKKKKNTWVISKLGKLKKFLQANILRSKMEAALQSI